MSGLITPTSSAYGVYPTYPPLSLLSFNPWKNPQAVAPPQFGFSLAHPFNISPDVYEALLHPAIPITVAILYGLAVYQINGLNRERNYKPWINTASGFFFWLVFAHNVLLAVYSAWTFAGMYNAIVPSWPGWDGEHGLAGVADALCKINGPRGLGSAATYDMPNSIWGFSDRSMKLLGGAPDSSDVGRIWNEGLAYYGFLFYLSKMYEVVDTVIVLAKGKTVSGLQCFHHAGAMIAVWAGIRYMSPPIWMFTFINAGIHTLMYTYYALAPLTGVPPQFKRTLTTLQIIQIAFGTSYALLHLFIAYDLPASTPYLFSKNLSSALPAVAKTISTAATSMATSVDYIAWFKKAALRAAGEEGLAENVRNYQGETFGIDAVHAAQVEKAQEEVRYRLTTTKVHCLDTSGQVFAILLNAIYLIPLAYLFCEFFYNTYMGNKQRVDVKTDEPEPIPTTPENIKKSANEAVNRVTAKVMQAIKDTQGGVTEAPPDVKAQLDDLSTKSKQIAKNAEEAVRDKSVMAKEEFEKDLAKMQERLKLLREKSNDVSEKALNKIKELAADAAEIGKKGASKAQKGAQDLGDKATKSGGSTLDAAAKAIDDIKRGVQEGYKKATEAASQNGQAVKEEAKAAADEADKKADETSEAAKKGGEDAADKTKEASKDPADEASKDVDAGAAKASEATDKAAEDSSAAKDKATDETSEKAKKGKDKLDEKKDDVENSLAPSASTEDERSIRSGDTGSRSRASTPSETPEKSKKKDKKDKKEKKGNWFSSKRSSYAGNSAKAEKSTKSENSAKDENSAKAEDSAKAENSTKAADSAKAEDSANVENLGN